MTFGEDTSPDPAAQPPFAPVGPDPVPFPSVDPTAVFSSAEPATPFPPSSPLHTPPFPYSAPTEPTAAYPTAAFPATPPQSGPPGPFAPAGGAPPIPPTSMGHPGGPAFPPTLPPPSPTGYPLGPPMVPHHGYYGTVWPPAPAERPQPAPARRGRLIAGIAAVVIAALAFSVGGALIGRSLAENSSSDSASSTYRAPTITVPGGSGNSGPRGSSSTSPTPTDPGGGTGLTPVDPNGSSSGVDAAAIAEAVKPGVVDIYTTLGYKGAQAAGTGMVLTADGEVLTNNHVIDGSTEISVVVISTGKRYKAQVVGTNPTADVALIKLDGASGLSTIKTGDSSKVAEGDPIVAMGNAGGTGGEPTVVSGSVAGLGRTITASDENGQNAERLSNLIQVQADIQAGESGGPLINAKGEVIGMNTAASSDTRFQSSSNEGYAIPIADALAVVEEIRAGRQSDTVHLGLPGFLGVELSQSASVSGSATVAGVLQNSPAASAGITAGATITSIDGKSISTPDDLTAVMAHHDPGDKVKVGWTDSTGGTHTKTVTLATGPAD